MGLLQEFLYEDTPSPALLDPSRYNVEELLRGLEVDLHLHHLTQDPAPMPLATKREGVAWRNLTSYAEAIARREEDPQAYNLALAMRWEEDRRALGGMPKFRYFTTSQADQVQAMQSVSRWRMGRDRPDRANLSLVVLEEDGTFSRFDLHPTGEFQPETLERKMPVARQTISTLIKKQPNGAHAYFCISHPDVGREEASKYYVRDFLDYADEIERRSKEGARRPITDLEQFLEDTLPTPFYDALEGASFALKDIFQHMLSLCGRGKSPEPDPATQVAEWIAKMVPCQPTGKAERPAEEMWTIFTETLAAASKEEVVRLLEGFKTNPDLGVGEYGFLRINKVAGKGGSSPDTAPRKSGSGAR